jgi:hypothetical protein
MDVPYLEKILQNEEFKVFGPVNKVNEAVNFLTGEHKTVDSDVKIVEDFSEVIEASNDILAKPRKVEK